MNSIWIADKTTGMFLCGGFYDPPYDPKSQVRVVFTDSMCPDMVLDRYDPIAGRRLATPQELAAAQAARVDALSANPATLVTVKILTATATALLEQSLGRVAKPAEIAAIVTRAKAIYQTL